MIIPTFCLSNRKAFRIRIAFTTSRKNCFVILDNGSLISRLYNRGEKESVGERKRKRKYEIAEANVRNLLEQNYVTCDLCICWNRDRRGIVRQNRGVTMSLRTLEGTIELSSRDFHSKALFLFLSFSLSLSLSLSEELAATRYNGSENVRDERKISSIWTSYIRFKYAARNNRRQIPRGILFYFIAVY